ncbi:MAG TPA: hypothetical protein VNP72_01875, partial [Longimicrobium sp.]|nr:hypothetical protein [Longimicrobium sp.]
VPAAFAAGMASAWVKRCLLCSRSIGTPPNLPPPSPHVKNRIRNPLRGNALQILDLAVHRHPRTDAPPGRLHHPHAVTFAAPTALDVQSAQADFVLLEARFQFNRRPDAGFRGG